MKNITLRIILAVACSLWSVEAATAQLYIGERIFEDQALSAPGAGFQNFVGRAVAVDGDWAIVGEPNKAAGALQNAGAVNFFAREYGGWTHRQVEHSSQAQASTQFGKVVDISGDTAVVGAPEHSNGAVSSGAVVVYENRGGIWVETQMLEGRQETIAFGISVALDGDTLLVGAHLEDYAGEDFGAVYAYERIGGSWVFSQLLVPLGYPSGLYDDLHFGRRVALDGNVAAVSTGFVFWGWPINYQDGQVIVYERVADQWVEVQKLIDPNPRYAGDFSGDFGESVSISDGVIAVGAPRYSDVWHMIPGSVSLFERSQSGVWGYTESIGASAAFFSTLTATNGFGCSVSLEGDRLLVGADTAKWVSWDAYERGQAFLFERSAAGSWEEKKVYRSQGTGVYAGYFGGSVSLSENYALIGDHTGRDAAGLSTGFAYIFEQDQGDSYCDNPTNSTGEMGSLRMNGSVDAADGLLTARITGLPSGQAGLLLAAKNLGLVDSPGGSLGDLCIGSGVAIGRVGVAVADASGVMEIPVNTQAIPLNPSTSILAGEQWFFQLWYRDHHLGATSNLSNAIRVDFE